MLMMMMMLMLMMVVVVVVVDVVGCWLLAVGALSVSCLLFYQSLPADFHNTNHMAKLSINSPHTDFSAPRIQQNDGPWKNDDFGYLN